MTVDGRALRESYVFPGDAPSAIRFTVTLRPGQVWLLGDNRSIALDSRLRGPAPLAGIQGRVTVIDANGRVTAVRTPAAFVAVRLAPPDHRPLLPYGWLAALLGAGLALIAEIVIGAVLHVRARRRRAAPPGVSWAQLPAGYSR